MPPLWESSRPVFRPRTVSRYFLSWADDFTAGAVHSVFSSSFNVAVGGRLIHVGSPPHPLSCLGLNAPAEELAPLLPGLRPGDRAVLKQSALWLYTSARVACVDYSGYMPVELSIGPAAGPERKNGLMEALEKLDLKERTGIPWDGALERTLGVMGGRAPTPGELEESVRFLLGRGKGLTPSGDDILMGYGAGRLLFGGGAEFQTALASVLRRQTTDVSLAYLRALLDGCVNEDYAGLFQAVREGEKRRYPGLLAQIQHNGHTSGSDSLLGLLTAVHVL